MDFSKKSLVLKRGAVNLVLHGFDELPDSAHVPLPVVCGIFGWSPATTWRRVRTGQLVQPVRLGNRTTRWNVGALRQSLAKMSTEGGAQ